MSAEPVIALDRVHKRFEGGRSARTVLDEVSLTISAGETFGLIGPAACGKSVLLKILCGLVEPDGGTAQVNAPRIGMLFQNNALFDFMTVGENVAFPLRRLGVTDEHELSAQVADRLKEVGLAGSDRKLPSELSGGMKKRAALARAVITRPPLLLFDEPTAGLDPVTTSKIYDLLRAERDQTGATVVAVSSDVEALCRFAPRVGMLYKGRLLYDGPSDAIADSAHEVVRQFVRGALEGPL